MNYFKETQLKQLCKTENNNFTIKPKCYYIVEHSTSLSSPSYVFKIFVEEITETTILFKNVDNKESKPHRKRKEDFNDEHNILEEITAINFNNILKQMIK